MDVNRHKVSEHKTWVVCPRRSFLITMLGLLGSLALPAWTKPDKRIIHSSLREAEFYRPREKM